MKNVLVLRNLECVLLMIPHMLENRKEGLTMNIFSNVEVKFLAIIYTILVIIFPKINKIC